jgi:redox-sensitive bicupin YhaK (pirin superfamily)
MHGFQIWVNLPARLKLTRPRYQEVPAARIPRASEGGATVRLIAGEALGQRAVIDTHTPIAFHDWTLEPNAEVTVPLPEAMSAMVYVFHGAATVGGKRLDEGQLGLLGVGAGVALRGADAGARLLLLAGEPHREPVARYGPFVMNTRQQLLEAFEDYESGRMGEITRTAEVR